LMTHTANTPWMKCLPNKPASGAFQGDAGGLKLAHSLLDTKQLSLNNRGG